MPILADRNLRSVSSRTVLHGVSWRANLLLTLPFLLLYWLNLYHHQSWFDEVNAWGIAAASPNLHTLFHLVHYEGHPWLWYFLLYWPSHLTHNPDQMKWVVALFGTGIFLVIGLLSPFTRLQKVLLFLSYFVAFEYTVTLRMYGLMFLLALIYAWRRSSNPGAILTNMALLAAMTNVDMTAVVLSGALLVEYLYTLLVAADVTAEKRKRVFVPVMAGLCLYGMLLAISIASLLPAKDISWQSSGHFGSQAFSPRPIFINIGDIVAAPWWPISPEFPERFWETDAHRAHALFLLVPLVLVAYWKSVRRQSNLTVLVGAALVFAFLWADFVYNGRVRHWGICYVAFVVALWIQSAEPVSAAGGPVRRERQSWSPWAYGLLSVSALAGVIATVSSWTHPMSQARPAARWLMQNEPPDAAITGQTDMSFISVAQQMQRPVYMMECDCTDTFKLFSRSHDLFNNDQLGARLSHALDHLHRQEIVFVFKQPMTPKIQADLKEHRLAVEPLAQFVGADLLYENFYIFQVRRINDEPSK